MGDDVPIAIDDGMRAGREPVQVCGEVFGNGRWNSQRPNSKSQQKTNNQIPTRSGTHTGTGTGSGRRINGRGTIRRFRR